MDLYLLDGLYRRIDVVDSYISLIWTERYKAYGDFQLQIEATRANRARFPLNTMCVILESNYVMQIDELENKQTEDGENILIVKGRSLEFFLASRPAIPAVVSLDTNPEWEISGRPSDIMYHLFQRICVDGQASSYDTIPSYTPGSFIPEGNIPYPADPVAMSFPPSDLYTALKKVADMWDLGFRLVRSHATNRFHFNVYSGNDRTSRQQTKTPVIFSPELDSLTDTTELSVSSGYKNVAIVLHKTHTALVFWPGTRSFVSGFDRRSIVVKVDQLEEGLTDDEILSALNQKGLEALSATRPITLFDGKTPDTGGYEYNKHYELGDLVEKRNTDGLATYLRVSEQIFACDQEGEKRYPTLSIEMTSNPGTWSSWSSTEEWITATGEWAGAG